MMLTENATRSKRTYSKTTCPLTKPKLMLLLMNDEWDDLPPDTSKSEQAPEGPPPSSSSKLPKRKVPLWGKIIIMSIIVFLGAIGYLRSHHDAENVADIQEGPSDVPEVDKRKPVPD